MKKKKIIKYISNIRIDLRKLTDDTAEEHPKYTNIN
jgi:hypothetical protein